MALSSKTFRNTSYLQSSSIFLLFFASWGVWWSFFQIWLTDPNAGLGLDGAQVGTVYSVNSIGTLVIMLAYGALQDKVGIKRPVALFCAAVMALVGPFCIYVYRPLLESNFMLGVVLGAVVLSAGFMAAVGLLEALCERLSRTYNFEYGQARMWGSFGYACVALMAGFLFTVDPHLNFWFGSVFGVLLFLVLLLWRNPAVPAHNITTVDPTSETTTPSIGDMLHLLRLPKLWVVIGLVLLSWTFYTVFDQQMFPQFYTQLYANPAHGQQVYGMLNSAQVFLEAVMMGVVPIIMRKIGVRNTLLLGVLVMCLRIFGCAVFHDPVMVSIVKMFHAFEVPLCILAVFRYLTLHFNPALSATLYMVGFNIAAQVGNIILSPILGSVRDSIGYQPTFFVISGIVLLAGIYGLLLLKKDDDDVEGDPFIRGRDVTAEAAEEALHEKAGA